MKTNIDTLIDEYTTGLEDSGFDRARFTLYCSIEEFNHLQETFENKHGPKGYFELEYNYKNFQVRILPQPIVTISVPVEEYWRIENEK